ncbi:FIST N-terminal domain-containing protein [Microcoleus sp. bin38.metabat.b11b12b14.051]|uniref:FIST signal transduction protein n=1 Tax=Microcoleus sp. bin38.metabat.b11b12b14.051 TaxID=2742709 RepID=UPI0025F8E364|nr:FIST N-terminal domain-containing protein [Microcoleus sp. bin38.metabat.b11b12b14.051]
MDKPNQMQWVSALSTRPSLESALREVVEQADRQLDGPADLALIFISSAFASEYSRLMPLLQELLPVPAILGCGGGGVIGTNRGGMTEEVEGAPAVSLSLARLPSVNVRTFHVSGEELPDLDSPPDTWVDLLGVPAEEEPQFIILADPFSAKINDLLQGLDYAYPGAPKVGGLAGGDGSRGAALFCDYQLYREGTVGVALSGNIVLETIVAQGCRPIGHPYRVTEGERNILLKLEEQTDDSGSRGIERSPLEALRELVQTLSEADRELAQHSLFVGLVSDEFKMTLEPGDFLIRNLLGVDPKVGAIAIGDRVRPGQRIQFHLRDARTSAEDLEVLLDRHQRAAEDRGTSSAGALMFSCLGRGEGLYGQSNFDSQLFGQYLKNIPLSGFFCNGEIGPVGGSTFLHGYTSVFGICRQNS